MLGVKTKEYISFYDWETQVHVRRIDVSPSPKNVYWSEDGSKVVLSLEENFYLLDFNEDEVVNYVNEQEGADKQGDEEEDEGCEDAF